MYTCTKYNVTMVSCGHHPTIHDVSIRPVHGIRTRLRRRQLLLLVATRNMDKADNYKARNSGNVRCKFLQGMYGVESDNPVVGIDSRQQGPIPVSCVRGKALARIWPPYVPIFNKENEDSTVIHRNWYVRPHPLPQDDATLAKYNVHPIHQRPNPST